MSRQSSDAWKNFVNSGSVRDYLTYASTKSNTAPEENENDHYNKRSGNKRNEYEGKRQGNNYSDKR
ncbi:MAG: hypothetical protein II388_01635 [Clostridia bacterium]|nr:hypothetical protein [Clostridia bacterium]